MLSLLFFFDTSLACVSKYLTVAVACCLVILLAFLIHGVLLKGEDALPQNWSPELTHYATMMAVIYNMMKQDLLMQVLISLCFSIIFYMLCLVGDERRTSELYLLSQKKRKEKNFFVPDTYACFLQDPT